MNVDATECPKCGCNDVEKIGQGVQFLRPWQKFRCNNCGRTWKKAHPGPQGDEPGVPVVDYHLMACPHCRSQDTTVTHTERPERRHKCRKCGKRFKSYEKSPE